MKMDKNVVNQNGKGDAFLSDGDLPVCFLKERHLEAIEGVENIDDSWRLKERMKTVSVALVLCLNVGVDPPDVVKTQPCARLECWIDPLTMSPTKALEKVGTTLQSQYERWQPRARYKQSLDPTTEEVKKLCSSLRRNAKEERVLFHYNGHGVPKPTTNGEIWVFNRTYTQYIPLSIYDLQTWMGAPSIYVYDCSNAGIIVESFGTFAQQHESEYEQAALQGRASSPPPPSYHNCIQLAACGATQVLPMNPELPADLFTACLTTPIKVALRWFLMQSGSKLVPKITMEEIDAIPGHFSDRKTMRGELNWIFTAITDTIAWDTLPKELFHKLFRQDLLVASLFRNFLLAERIMRSCDCTPISVPQLPPTHQHAMWKAWDLVVDLSLGQLHGILYKKKPFENLPFFEEQLRAFEVWLELGSDERNPPEQLPIVLQVLLSQVHRMRALELLGRFIDLGSWAVQQVLSLGIYPYILKLLQSTAPELKTLLVFMWVKIIAVDRTCKYDLMKENGHRFFLMTLQDTSLPMEYRTYSAYIISVILQDHFEGQVALQQSQLVNVCMEQLTDSTPPPLRQWIAITLGRLWEGFEPSRWTGYRDGAHEKLMNFLQDPHPEVRAAAVFALGTFINSCNVRHQGANSIDNTIARALIAVVGSDMSALVRKELVAALQWVVLSFKAIFIQLALTEQSRGPDAPLKRIASRDRLRDDPVERMMRVSSSSSIHNIGHGSPLNQSQGGSMALLGGLGVGAVHCQVWQTLCNMEFDPHPEVAAISGVITEHVRSLARDIIAGKDFVDSRSSESVDGRSVASLSLPPSPNRSSYLSDESPPNVHLSPNELPSFSSRTLPAQKKTPKKIPHIKEAVLGGTKIYSKASKSLISTKFIDWAGKVFAQPLLNNHFKRDVESKLHHEKEWRFIRNDKIRKEAQEEQKRALTSKLDCQVFNTRTNLPPSFLQFHPYDQQIAVAGKNSFSIINWGTGVKNTSYSNKSKRSSSAKISALEWINGHDIAMLMVAFDDGSVNIFKQAVGSREPRLIATWQAFNDSKYINLGVLLCWEQSTQTVVTAGDSRLIRFWDAEKEVKAFDIPTGTDSAVSCVDSSFSNIAYDRFHSSFDRFDSCNGDRIADGFDRMCNGYLVAGCVDGSVRLFDRRCAPNDVKVKVWNEHSRPVLGVQMLKDNLVISGSAAGDVKLYDIRKNGSINTQNVQNHGISSLAIHRNASIYSCATPSQSICVYNLQGSLLNSFKSYEGFMGHRIGPINCLSFHPHKVVLATGTADNSVSVYCLEGRR